MKFLIQVILTHILKKSNKMNKLKVVTLVGTRPEIIRLSRVLNKLDDSSVIDHILIHSGQNYDYELNQIFFEDLFCSVVFVNYKIVYLFQEEL